MVGRTREEQLKLVRKRPDSPPDAERLNVAIIGTPNAGKSTLTNRLMNWRITSVSQKVHTTRNKVVGVYTQTNKQLIFLDTPGVVPASAKKRHHLEESLINDPFSVLDVADIIAVVVDVSNKYSRTTLDKLILKALMLNPKKKSILILNKVDAIKKKDTLLTLTRTLSMGQVGGQKTLDRTLRDQKNMTLDHLSQKLQSKNVKDSENTDWITESSHGLVDNRDELITRTDDDQNKLDIDLSVDICAVELIQNEKDVERKLKLINTLIKTEPGWAKFDRVFMISALTGDGVDILRDYLLSETKPESWSYHSTTVTDQDPIAIVKMCVWEKLLEHLPKEIPYNISVEVPMLEVNDEGLLQVVVNVWCKDRRHVVFAIGKEGSVVKRISSEAKQEIMNTFRCEVQMKVVVKEISK